MNTEKPKKPRRRKEEVAKNGPENIYRVEFFDDQWEPVTELEFDCHSMADVLLEITNWLAYNQSQDCRVLYSPIACRACSISITLIERKGQV